MTKLLKCTFFKTTIKNETIYQVGNYITTLIHDLTVIVNIVNVLHIRRGLQFCAH